jgi:hypothetical protein
LDARRWQAKQRLITRPATLRSRAALERLLDPANQSITLQTLGPAAKALGRRLQIILA